MKLRHLPGEGLLLYIDHEITSVMGYRILLEGSGTHHSNTGLQITHDKYINGSFMLLFDQTPDHGVSEAHTSLHENGYLRIELEFSLFTRVSHLPSVLGKRPLGPDKFLAQNHARLLIDTFQILCTLRDVTSFLDMFPSDLLPSLRPILKQFTLIYNADPHTEGGSHSLAISITPRCSSAYYFDLYGIVPLVPAIQGFLKRHCTTWDYNKRQLQGLSSDV
jgi:hypothetical protein